MPKIEAPRDKYLWVFSLLIYSSPRSRVIGCHTSLFGVAQIWRIICVVQCWRCPENSAISSYVYSVRSNTTSME
jgi:hypothetical protein